MAPTTKLFDRHRHSYFQEIPGGLILEEAYTRDFTVFQRKVRDGENSRTTVKDGEATVRR